MLSLKNNITVEYNKMYDILYVKVKDSDDSYVDEKNKGILFNCDFITNEIVGFDIWDFTKRIERNESINLPIKIDFIKIYNDIKKTN